MTSASVEGTHSIDAEMNADSFEYGFVVHFLKVGRSYPSVLS